MNTLKPTSQYELAAKIGFFLIGKGLNSWGQWSGRMTKAEQVKAFGYYFGKGLITVDGMKEEIYSTIKVCFGMDWCETCGINAKTGEWFDNNTKGPLNKLLKGAGK